MIRNSWRLIQDDASFARAQHSAVVSRYRLVALLMSPGMRAAFLMRVASGGGRTGAIFRSVLLALHSCDVSPGASIGAPMLLPHPHGITIGKGAEIGSRCILYQNVTIGASRKGSYPSVGDDVVVYPGAVIAGGVSIGARSMLGALTFTARDVVAGGVVRLKV